MPLTLGLPSIEKFKGLETSTSSKQDNRTSLSVKEILFKYVLCNEYIWLVAIAYFFIYIIRIGFNDWIMVYLVKSRGYSDVSAASCIVLFEVGGFLGSVFSGWSTDKFFGGKRNPVNVLCTSGAIGALLVLYLSATGWFYLDAAMIFLVGFFIFGPQMLLGMVAAELTHKKAAATSSGFAGWFAYLGGAVAGAPLGALIGAWGWSVFFAVLLGCGFAAIALILPLWSIKARPSPTQVQKEEEKPAAKTADSIDGPV